MWQLELLEGQDFLACWPHISEMMDRVPHTWTDLTKDEVENRALVGGIQVWGVGDEKAIRMVLFTQIAVYSTGKALQVLWAAGQGRIHEKARDSVDYTLTEFAKDQGCSRIDIIGRAGWEKLLAPIGFKREAIILSRPVIHRGMQ